MSVLFSSKTEIKTVTLQLRWKQEQHEVTALNPLPHTRGHVQLRGRRRAAGQRVGRVALRRRAVAVFALAGRPLHLREVGPLPLAALLLQLHAFLRVGLAPRLLLLHLLEAATARAGQEVRGGN